MKSNLRKSRAFTLVELLVVIGVIAILVALLMSALSRGKPKAFQTACLNNLKQINLGVHIYAGDNGDKAPDGGPGTYILYMELVKSYVGLHGPSSMEDRVFACQSDAFYYDESTMVYVPHSLHLQRAHDFSSYTFNGLNLLTNYPNVAYNGLLPGIGGQKLEAVKSTARTVLVAEAAALVPYSWHEPRPPVTGGGWPMLNDAKDMVSFVDGHGSYIKMYWNSTVSYPNGGVSVAAYYDPPAGYEYQWSGR